MYFQSIESCKEAGGSNCTPVKLASAGDKMYWKIIRVNGDGSLRLIYNGTSPKGYVDNSSLPFISSNIYNYFEEFEEPMAFVFFNGRSSLVKSELDTWYNNTLGSNDSYDSKVIKGNFCSDTSDAKEAEEYGFQGIYGWVFKTAGRLSQYASWYSMDNEPTFKCNETDFLYGGSYKLKVGLITADEVAFAGAADGVSSLDGYLKVDMDSYQFWTMSPYGTYEISNVWLFSSSGLGGTSYADGAGIRPVINISKDNGFIETGDGTEDNPYVLS